LKPSGIIPSPRRGHSAVNFGNFIIIFGGVNENYLNDMFYFYPSKKVFKKIENVKGELPKLCNLKGVLGPDNTVYYFGGYNNKGL